MENHIAFLLGVSHILFAHYYTQSIFKSVIYGVIIMITFYAVVDKNLVLFIIMILITFLYATLVICRDKED